MFNKYKHAGKEYFVVNHIADSTGRSPEAFINTAKRLGVPVVKFRPGGPYFHNAVNCIETTFASSVVSETILYSRHYADQLAKTAPVEEFLESGPAPSTTYFGRDVVVKFHIDDYIPFDQAKTSELLKRVCDPIGVHGKFVLDKPLEIKV